MALYRHREMKMEWCCLIHHNILEAAKARMKVEEKVYLDAVKAYARAVEVYADQIASLHAEECPRLPVGWDTTSDLS